jgi:translocator protein
VNARAARAAPLAVAALCAFALGALGAWLTDLDAWYRALIKPSWQPPDAAFGPAWTAIFALGAVAAARGWTYARDRAARVRLVALFGINMVLNTIWTALFFRLHRPDWALDEVFVLWLSIAALVWLLSRQDRPATALLLVPYLAWVAFAAWLNLAIVRLNGPFA